MSATGAELCAAVHRPRLLVGCAAAVLFAAGVAGRGRYILSAVIADVLRSFAGAGKTVLFSTTTTSLSGSSPASSTYTPPTKRGTRWHSLCATALRACS